MTIIELRRFLQQLFLILISLLTLVACKIEVYVSRNFSNHSCSVQSNDVIKCNSLSSALDNPNFTKDSCIYVETDLYLNESIDIGSSLNLSITSNGKTITCKQGVSLRFRGAHNTNISGLNFKHCGSLVELDWSYKDLVTNLVNVSAALSFIKSKRIQMTGSIIQASEGYGLVFDESDEISIKEIDVVNSKHFQTIYQDKNHSLGGGVLIHWQQSDSNYVSIVKSNFTDSQNRHFEEIVEPISNLPYEKGAGVAIFFGANVQSNFVLLENVTVSNNSASMGAGIYVHFADDCNENIVQSEATILSYNKAKNYGAGLFVHKDSRKDNNEVNFKKSIFIQNEANVGGAICLVYFGAKDMDDRMGTFHFNEIEMFGNKARVGSAMHCQNVVVHLIDISISNSSARPYDNIPGQGSLYSLRSTLNFTGNLNSVKQSDNTAIILDSSDMLAGGTIVMHNNVGYNGGALAFYEHSRIFLSRLTRLSFVGNMATNKGGAIYALMPGPALMPFNTTELNMYGCFIQFVGSTEKSFKGRVTFRNNTCTDALDCDIFASSLQSCAYPTDSNRSVIISSWKNFDFYENKATSIKTNAINLHPLIKEEWVSYPGDLLNPKIVLKDERENDVQESINVAIEPDDQASVETNPAFVVDEDESIRIALLKTKIDPVETSAFNIRLKTTSEVFLEDLLKNVTFKPCRFGYSLQGSESCECDVLNNEDNGIAVCDNDNIHLERYRWVDPLEVTSHICPIGYCFNNESERFNPYIKDRQCSNDRNQTSRLCSQCKHGYSISSAHSRCLKCDPDSKGWIYISLVNMSGLIFFIALVMFMDIDIMSYNINICLYSYQVIDLLYTNEESIDPFLSIVMSMFQFNGVSSRVYPSFCMWDGMNDLHKIAYGYFIPIWLSVAMLLLYFMVRKRRTWLQRWLKTMSIVSVMCFSDYLRISFELLHSTKINGKNYLYRYAEVEYFGDEHLPYAIVAISVLIVITLFSIAQILLLWRANVNSFEWLRRFQDNISNYFKKDKKWFWMFYIACRVEMYAIGIFLPNERKLQLVLLSLSCLLIATIFAYSCPFEDGLINSVETFVFGTLSIISALSVGIRNVFSREEQAQLIIFIHVLSYIPFLSIIFAIVHAKLFPTKRFKGARKGSTVYHPVRVFDSYDSHRYGSTDNKR